LTTEEQPVRATDDRIKKKIGEAQVGKIRIGAQIIKVLSEGTYTSLENALKELINNSYDSDATYAKVAFDSKKEVLTIQDDGNGMNYQDFQNNFAVITGSEKRQRSQFTEKYHRPIIGKIGIGFVSSYHLCEKMIIRSAKGDSDTWFSAEIDWGQIRKRIRELEGAKKEFYEISRFTLTNYDKPDPAEHYTVIELHGLSKDFLETLRGEQARHEVYYTFTPQAFDNFESVITWIAKNIKNTDKQLSSYWSFVLNLAAILPISYVKDGPVRGDLDPPSRAKLNEIKSEIEGLNFKVLFDGWELKKPVLLPCIPEQLGSNEYKVFPLDDDIKVEDNTHLKIKGYFYNQRGGIEVENWRGMVIRIKNVAIGSPDNSFMDFPFPGEKIYMPWTYGEIYVVEGLEDAMKVDRSDFMTNHLHYRALKAYIHHFLHSKVFLYSRQEYYKRSEQKLQTIQESHSRARKEMARDSYGQGFDVVVTDRYSEIPTSIDESKRVLQVFTNSKPFVRMKKDQRILLADVLVAFEAALKASNGDPQKLRTKFVEYLTKIPRRS
jgi:hypothetical protein